MHPCQKSDTIFKPLLNLPRVKLSDHLQKLNLPKKATFKISSLNNRNPEFSSISLIYILFATMLFHLFYDYLLIDCELNGGALAEKH